MNYKYPSKIKKRPRGGGPNVFTAPKLSNMSTVWYTQHRILGCWGFCVPALRQRHFLRALLCSTVDEANSIIVNNN